jgi:hypothetical protein
METFNSWTNTLVKGRDLNSLGLIWVKVTNENMLHHDFQLKLGENIDNHELTQHNCSQGGIYFCPFDLFGMYCEYGNGYHEVSFTDDEDVWIEENKCKARRIVLGEKKLFINMSIDECKIAVAQDWYSIRYMSNESRNDHEICKIAAAQDGYSIEYMSEERRNDPEICKIAAEQNGISIKYMSKKMKNDPEICKITAAQYGLSIRYMSEERRNDPEICKIAAEQNGISIQFMSKERRNDPEICKISAAQNRDSIQFMDK